jgi:hypothetical protein
MQRESIALFLQLRRGALYAQAYRVMTAAVACSRITMLALLYPFASLRKKDSRLALALRKWTKLLRWSFGLERWVATVGRPNSAQPAK